MLGLWVTGMTDPQRTPWPGSPCTSHLWPLSSALAVFEARRAIGQLARDLPKAEVPEDTNGGPEGVPNIALGRHDALDYISATLRMKAAIDTVLPELVAQAVAEGKTWREIGAALGVGKTAPQKQYREVVSALKRMESLPPFDESPELFAAHNDAVDHLMQTADDEWTLHLASLAGERLLAYVINGIAFTDEGGFTPEGKGEPLDSRVSYLHNRVTGALAHVDRFIKFVEENGSISGEQLLNIHTKALSALSAAEDLIYDHHAWGELVEWFRRRPLAEERTFDAPIIYCRQVFFLILVALWYLHLVALNAISDEFSGERIRIFFERVRECLGSALTLMLRDDVLRTFYPVHGAYLRRTQSAEGALEEWDRMRATE